MRKHTLPREIRLGIFGGKLQVTQGKHTTVSARSDREFLGTLTVSYDSDIVEQHASVVQTVLGLTWAAGRQLGLWTQGAEGTSELSTWILKTLVNSCLYNSKELRWHLLRWHLQVGRRAKPDAFGVPSRLTLSDETTVVITSQDHDSVSLTSKEDGAVLFAPRRLAARHLALMTLTAHLGATQLAMEVSRGQLIEAGRALLHGLVLTKLYKLDPRSLAVLREEIEREQAQSPSLVSRALLRRVPER